MTRSTRIAWQVFGSVLTVALVAAGVVSAVGLLAHEVHTEVDRFPAGSVDAVRIDTEHGRIEVRAGSTDQIVVEARVSSSLGTTGRSGRIVGRTLELSSTCPPLSTWCGVDWTVTVPADVDVYAESHNESISVTGVHGAVTVEAHNGDVELRDLAGPLQVANHNGRVQASNLETADVEVANHNGDVRLLFADAPSQVRVRSHNGSIDIGVPDEPGAFRVDASTRNGDRNVDIRTDPSSIDVIDISSDNGSVTVAYGLP